MARTAAHTNHTHATTGKFLHRSLWAVQIVLGLAFVMAGSMKTSTPYAELAQKMAWVGAVPEGLVRLIGISELLGGLGLIVPAATRIKPWLTPLAAAGLVVVMVLALGFHLSRGEVSVLPVNLVLGLLAAFVAWGRTWKSPVRARETAKSFTL
jgi:putative oxidoreductase